LAPSKSSGRKVDDLPPDALNEAIDRAYDANPRTSPPRSYIGASGLGNECDAYLELCLRGFEDGSIKPKTRRIMDLGTKIEDMVIADLRLAGYTVQDRDPKTGKQWEWKMYGGHMQSHADGVISLGSNPPCLLEVKSMNDDYFNKFRLHGLAKSHPKYVSQCQTLMGMSGYGRTMVVGYNKDKSLYAHEFIHVDPLVWQAQKQRVEDVAGRRNVRAGRDENRWPCSMCFKKFACWHAQGAPRNCAGCIHAKPVDDGTWHCELHNKQATAVCPSWQVFQPKPKR
jgi:hypothetical protein